MPLGYKFNNLIDDENNIIKAFNINVLPTKMVIDRNSNIRFISFGYDNNDEGFISELKLMIDRVK